MKIKPMEHTRTGFISLLTSLVPVFILTLVALSACHPAKHATHPTPVKPTKPVIPGRNEPIDTIRWAPNKKPPIKNEPNKPGDRPSGMGDTYHIGYLLPFLTNQATPGSVPEKSRLALQFYAGAKIALEQASTETNLNLIVDAWDTQATDADFQALLNTAARIQKPTVFIGPIRSSHVQLFAEWAKSKRKIVISPESPNADLTSKNPDFIQTNPSLRSHCAAITNYVRKANRPDAVTLVCKQKESDRLPYFQEVNSGLGGGAFAELIVPDAATNFEKADLRKYIKAGRTSVFIMPSWASQDFVMAFLQKLKEVKGANRVEVYGMPQWRNYEVIDAEYFTSLNVHISAGSYVDYTADDVKAFQQKFYDATGTIPDEDAFNGYDVTLFTIRMLARHGLSFPESLESERFTGLHGSFGFSKIYSEGGPDAGNSPPDYLENTQVHILKFGKFGFAPVK